MYQQHSEANVKPRKILMMQDFAKLVNGQEPLTNLTKRSITCVQQGPILFLE